MRELTPFSSPTFSKQCEFAIGQSFGACVSGEFTANQMGTPIGAVKKAGQIANVFLSCIASGKDDSNTLSFTCDVFINGVSCLTTPPVIAHVSGEASTSKTTKLAVDTGITAAVMDTTANSLNPGDVVTYDLVLTRTASPTTEMNTPCVVVELEPVSP